MLTGARFRFRISASAALLTALGGCDQQVVDPARRVVLGPANRVILDGAHGGGSPRLYFLPPLVPAPTFGGTFDATAFGSGSSDSVYVCVFSGTACRNRIASFTGGTSSSSVQMDASTESYQVSWNTFLQLPPLDRSLIYRIVVVVRGTIAGYADVVPVASGQPTRNIDRSRYVVAIVGSVVQIRFRLEVPSPKFVDISAGSLYTCGRVDPT